MRIRLRPDLLVFCANFLLLRYYDAIARFVYGLGHDDAHLAQIADVVQQAKAA